MYESFYGLTSPPFSMTADPSMLCILPNHREALAALSYGTASRKGLMALIGDAGTGKTSIVMRLAGFLTDSKIRSSIVLNPLVTATELLEMIVADFGIADARGGKAQLLHKLQAFLLEECKRGNICLLIVDEAHRLSPDLLEELRLLINFETPRQKLLQIVLSGQPELGAVLNEPGLRQLKQRIAVRVAVKALVPDELPVYIRHRWSRCSQTEAPFPSASVSEIARFSGGIPRLINSICDNALITAFAEQSRVVTPAHVREAALDLDLWPARVSTELRGTEGSGGVIRDKRREHWRIATHAAGPRADVSLNRENENSGVAGATHIKE